MKADISIFDIPDISFPFITHVHKEETIPHYYTIFNEKRGKVIIADPDPAVRIKKVPIESFRKSGEEWLFFLTRHLNIHFRKMGKLVY